MPSIANVKFAIIRNTGSRIYFLQIYKSFLSFFERKHCIVFSIQSTKKARGYQPCDIRHFTILQYSRNIITVTMIHCSNTPCKSTKIGRWNRHRNTSIACSGKKSRRPTSRITRNNNIRLINGQLCQCPIYQLRNIPHSITYRSSPNQ